MDLNKCDNQKITKQDEKEQTQSFSKEKIVHFVEEALLKTDSNNVCMQNEHDLHSADFRKSYCFSIYLNKIKFFSSRPDIKNIEFR